MYYINNLKLYYGDKILVRLQITIEQIAETKLKEFNEEFGYTPIDLSSIKHQDFLAKISEIEIPTSNDRDRKAVINGYAHSLLKKMVIFYLS